MTKYLSVPLIGLGILALTFQSCEKEETVEQPAPSVEAKYNDDIKDIMNNYCVTCHAGATPFGNLSLTTYAEVKDAAQNRNLYARMTSDANPMPASGKLSADKLAKVNAWIQNGYPEH